MTVSARLLIGEGTAECEQFFIFIRSRFALRSRLALELRSLFVHYSLATPVMYAMGDALCSEGRVLFTRVRAELASCLRTGCGESGAWPVPGSLHLALTRTKKGKRGIILTILRIYRRLCERIQCPFWIVMTHWQRTVDSSTWRLPPPRPILLLPFHTTNLPPPHVQVATTTPHKDDGKNPGYPRSPTKTPRSPMHLSPPPTPQFSLWFHAREERFRQQ